MSRPGESPLSLGHSRESASLPERSILVPLLNPIAAGFRLAVLAVLCFASLTGARAADISDHIRWPEFLARHDLVWKRLPDKWGSGALMGNGLLGANVFTTDDGQSLRWRIGRSDVVFRGNRIPVGDLVLKTAGTLEGGELRLGLWNAELNGHIKTSRGTIQIRSFTHAQLMVQVIEIKPDAGEKECHFDWEPGLAADPRKIYQKQPIPDDERNLDPILSQEYAVHLCVQPLLGHCEHATAWKEVARQDGSRVLCLSVGFGGNTGLGQQGFDALLDFGQFRGDPALELGAGDLAGDFQRRMEEAQFGLFGVGQGQLHRLHRAIEGIAPTAVPASLAIHLCSAT